MKWITAELIDGLIAQAGGNARRRTNHNIHELPADPVQRLFVAARADSYFRPHRHQERAETAIVIRVLLDVLVFDDAGRVVECASVGPGAAKVGFEMPANTWHSWVPRTDDAVFFETKQGPYDPQTAAEFASWAPAEGTPQVKEFVARLRTARVGDRIA